MINRFSSKIRTILNVSEPWEQRVCLNKNLKVRRFTFRDTADYDDAWFAALCKTHSRIFDVGANVGYNSLIAFAANPKSQVVLVEANAQALAISAENIIHNGFSDRARFVCCFAGDKDDYKIDFWTKGTGAAGSIFPEHAMTAKKKNKSIQIVSQTLDSISRNIDFVPDLIKVDVEGAEINVLNGAKNLAMKHGISFIVEIHSNPVLTMYSNVSQILNWAKASKYTVWYLSKHQKLSDPKEAETRGRFHALLLPSNQNYPDYLKHIPQSAPLSLIESIVIG